jgi:very-short-patch-repair endonuclease
MARRDKHLLEFAREMRKEPTWLEHLQWQELRRGQFGVRFRRQEPIGPYIADFVCLRKALIIELDGESHDDPLYDAMRDAWFHDHGFFVLRIDNDHIRDDLEGALDLIQQALDDPESIDDPLNLKRL